MLLAGPDGESEDFSSPRGQRTLYYSGHGDYDDDFLPYAHPRWVNE